MTTPMIDETGRRHGPWLVREWGGNTKDHRALWVVDCVRCAHAVVISGTVLRRCTYLPCEACGALSPEISVGDVFGRLRAVGPTTPDNRNRERVICRCSCGQRRFTRARDLLTGKLTACTPCTAQERGEA